MVEITGKGNDGEAHIHWQNIQTQNKSRLQNVNYSKRKSRGRGSRTSLGT
jgi:hypothetical protein